MYTTIPHRGSDLDKGDRVDLTDPPKHCGTPMKVADTPYGHRLDCFGDDCEIHTDPSGVLTELPFVTEED
ncbi:hypothetical protein [Streptomyces axinellae]|uniref:Uncharacterized protein n=1 Tax=Streptomyces axinellae TaxID=552788 RepID=A0ABN3QM66_9ACTN